MPPFIMTIANDDERSKLEQLYLLSRDGMYHKALSYLDDRMAAEDAVQEAFIKVMSAYCAIILPWVWLDVIEKSKNDDNHYPALARCSICLFVIVVAHYIFLFYAL